MAATAAVDASDSASSRDMVHVSTSHNQPQPVLYHLLPMRVPKVKQVSTSSSMAIATLPIAHATNVPASDETGAEVQDFLLAPQVNSDDTQSSLGMRGTTLLCTSAVDNIGGGGGGGGGGTTAATAATATAADVTAGDYDEASTITFDSATQVWVLRAE